MEDEKTEKNQSSFIRNAVKMRKWGQVTLFKHSQIVYNEQNINADQEVGSMQDRFNTTKLAPIQESGNEAQNILMYVYDALQAKGYDPITQMVGYIISGDPTYITSYNSARSLICRLERDEILEEVVRFYVRRHLDADET